MHNSRRLSAWSILKREVLSAHEIWRDYFIPHSGNNHHPHIWYRRHVHLIAGLLLASKVTLVVILFSFVPYGAQLSPEVEQTMIKLTNEYRQQLQEQPLSRNTYLDSVALMRANDMIEKNYFSHYTPDGRKPWEWVNTKQYNYSRFGENLAMDFITAEAVFKAFVASPSHEKNLRNVNYRDIGVAMVSGMIDGKETNVMVVLFGAQQPKPVPVLAEVKPTPTPTPTPKAAPQPKVAVVPDPRTAAPKQLETSVPIATPPAEVKGLAVVEQLSEAQVVIRHDGTWLEKMVSYSHDIYFLLVIAFAVIALLNIFVAIRVQHRSTIIASFLLIALASYLWLANWHSAEGLSAGISVLGWIL